MTSQLKAATPIPFKFETVERAQKASKRLKSVLARTGIQPHPLGWHRMVLARMVGYRDWDALRRGSEADIPGGVLDHDLPTIGTIMERRRAQAQVLAHVLDQPLETARSIIDEVEPTGNGNGPKILGEAEDGKLAFTLRLPPIPPTIGDDLLLSSSQGQDVLSRNVKRILNGSEFDEVASLIHLVRVEETGEGRCVFSIRNPIKRSTVSATMRISRHAVGYCDADFPLRRKHFDEIVLLWAIEETGFPYSRRRHIPLSLAVLTAMGWYAVLEAQRLDSVFQREGGPALTKVVFDDCILDRTKPDEFGIGQGRTFAQNILTNIARVLQEPNSAMLFYGLVPLKRSPRIGSLIRMLSHAVNGIT